MNDFKAYATRTLNEKHGLLRHENWARHGSTRYLWTREDAEAAVRYVLFLQGRPMETYFAASVLSARAFA
ncbi:MAG: hypothetical protein HY315_07405 [Acidobacteria bacterium]|nr:hypothetical protein [Acidobacteriota bacterium]